MTSHYLPLRTHVCKHLFDSLVSVLPGIYAEIERLGQKAILSLVLEEAPVFHSDCIYLPICNARGPRFLHPLATTCYFPFLILAILVGVKWHLSVHFPDD